jgi:hypothetical protein
VAAGGLTYRELWRWLKEIHISREKTEQSITQSMQLAQIRDG